MLQTIAWAEMLRAYTASSCSVAEAVEQTFDGQHPCELCREIQSAKAKEKSGAPMTAKSQDDSSLKGTLTESPARTFAPIGEKSALPAMAFAPVRDRTDRPLLPPPRSGHRTA